MAILVRKPARCTFIHIPKNAGSSIQRWLQENHSCSFSKGQKHCDVEAARDWFRPRDKKGIGTTYCVVRNPFDWSVSWYEFIIRRAAKNIDYILKNPHVQNIKKGSGRTPKRYSLARNQEIISMAQEFSHEDGDLAPIIRPIKSFRGFLKDRSARGELDLWKPQYLWAEKCDIIMRFENIRKDFVQIQEMLQCWKPLGIYNSSGRSGYEKYYDDEAIDIIKKVYKKDLDMFGYKF